MIIYLYRLGDRAILGMTCDPQGSRAFHNPSEVILETHATSNQFINISKLIANKKGIPLSYPLEFDFIPDDMALIKEFYL